MPMQMAPSGTLALQQRAAQGDPAAIEQLQALGMMPPQQAPQQPPPGAMTQQQFAAPKQVPPDIAAKRAQQLIKMLRAHQQ
jgi:hypothetical protein